ncbi:hypothetical protein D1BOALGB6SA_2616 [Olavius sp. associated proteobacterium Delta 1]|nr:hypothetical protein D1BOALGB6SA_2616 [Olavius sp. associated proteobacterium Delta 1]
MQRFGMKNYRPPNYAKLKIHKKDIIPLTTDNRQLDFTSLKYFACSLDSCV